MEINTLQESITKRAQKRLEQDADKLEREMAVLQTVRFEFFVKEGEHYVELQNHQVLFRIREAFLRDRLKFYVERETEEFLETFEDIKNRTLALEEQYLTIGGE